MFWFAGEVMDLADGAVVLTQGLVQEHSGPVSMPELCLTDELNSSGLDSIHIDPFTNDERVCVLCEDVCR